ncbi:MAG: 2Fe-2S iron-sulfur cluster-binding protein [Janthinobacterium lividum]
MMREQPVPLPPDADAPAPDRLSETPNRVTHAGFWESLAAPWDSGIDDVLICTHVQHETPDVKTFIFRALEKRSFVFEPGQFITVELEIDGEPVNRCYTISSSPTRPHSLAITVKRVPGGLVSNWLHDQLAAGGAIRALGPAGAFTCARHPANKFLFLSAGSGITPLMSMSRAHHDLGEDRDIVFVHSARTPDDIVFERELALIAAHHARFRTSFICERRGARPDWHGVTGYLSLPLLQLIAPDYLEREIFVCGPAPYMSAVRNLLAEGGFDRRHYHEESFSFDTILEVASQLAIAHVADALAAPAAAAELLQATPTRFEQGREPARGFGPATAALPVRDAAPADLAVAVATGFKVDFAKSRREVDCAGDQTVLDAARKAGLRMPSSCAQGMCGTCKVKVISGEVDMKHAGGIRQREIDQGMVLLCCSKPKTDLVIDK